MRARGAAIAGLAAVALATGACRLPRESATPRYWLLTPIESDVAAPASPTPHLVGVGPVELPTYLDRSGVVTRSGAQLEVAPYDLWGQPFVESVTQVLGRNLERVSPGTSAEVFPWNVASRELDHQVAVRIDRFEADSDGAVHLDAEWDVRNGAGTELVTSGRASIRELVRTGGVQGIVDAMNRALGQLSRAIAGQLGETRATQSGVR